MCVFISCIELCNPLPSKPSQQQHLEQKLRHSIAAQVTTFAKVCFSSLTFVLIVEVFYSHFTFTVSACSTACGPTGTCTVTTGSLAPTSLFNCAPPPSYSCPPRTNVCDAGCGQCCSTVCSTSSTLQKAGACTANYNAYSYAACPANTTTQIFASISKQGSSYPSSIYFCAGLVLLLCIV